MFYRIDKTSYWSLYELERGSLNSQRARYERRIDSVVQEKSSIFDIGSYLSAVLISAFLAVYGGFRLMRFLLKEVQIRLYEEIEQEDLWTTQQSHRLQQPLSQSGTDAWHINVGSVRRPNPALIVRWHHKNFSSFADATKLLVVVHPVSDTTHQQIPRVRRRHDLNANNSATARSVIENMEMEGELSSEANSYESTGSRRGEKGCERGSDDRKVRETLSEGALAYGLSSSTWVSTAVSDEIESPSSSEEAVPLMRRRDGRKELGPTNVDLIIMIPFNAIEENGSQCQIVIPLQFPTIREPERYCVRTVHYVSLLWS